MFLWNIVGALVGYQFSGSWIGAVLGWFLTSLIARFVVGKSSRPAPAAAGAGRSWRPGVGRAQSTESRQLVFLETVFQLMGRLAKADGRISEREVAHTEAFMSQLGMSTDRRREAISLFKQGADPQFDVDGALARFQHAVGRSPHLRQLLLVYLMDVALADGEFKGPEEQLLRRIGADLGFSAFALEQLIAMTRGQDHFGSRAGGGGAGVGRGVSGLEAAYQALGVTPEDSDNAIKRAYRKLISEFHPDKLIGQGVPEDMVQAATERSQEIQRAYDVIKDARGL
ncbi:MAG: co-chaperone DjlA [Pseudomonadota bacterium]